MLTTNVVRDPLFVDVNGFDYHLAAGSPGINAGTESTEASDFPLKPFYQYAQPACGEQRNPRGIIDAGAYKFRTQGPFDGAGAPLVCR